MLWVGAGAALAGKVVRGWQQRRALAALGRWREHTAQARRVGVVCGRVASRLRHR